MRNDPPAALTYAVDDWLAAAGQENDAATIPGRLVRLVTALSTAPPGELNTNDPVATRIADRQAAVLVLLKDTTGGPEVILLQRSYTLRDHPGEIAFPGGSRESTDRIPPPLPCGKEPKKLASTPAASTRGSPFRAFILASRASMSPQLSPSGANPAPSIRSIPPKHTGYSPLRCPIWTIQIAGTSTSATTGPGPPRSSTAAPDSGVTPPKSCSTCPKTGRRSRFHSIRDFSAVALGSFSQFCCAASGATSTHP